MTSRVRRNFEKKAMDLFQKTECLAVNKSAPFVAADTAKLATYIVC